MEGKPGLLFGDLRQAVYRLEDIHNADTCSAEEREFRMLETHVSGMVAIQIAQELNEIKQALVRIADAQEERVDRKKADPDKMPFIH